MYANRDHAPGRLQEVHILLCCTCKYQLHRDYTEQLSKLLHKKLFLPVQFHLYRLVSYTYF